MSLVFLDTKRYILLISPIILMILAYVFSDSIIKYIPVKIEKKDYSRFISSYENLLNLKVPKNKKIFYEDIFNYFTIVRGKKIKHVQSNKNEKAPLYKIEFIYIRKNSKYVIINGRIYREGDKISDKEYIAKIKEDGILLNGYWGLRWIKF